jgi:predicted ATP-grasp superfamily ATP-dependent carboligase
MPPRNLLIVGASARAAAQSAARAGFAVAAVDLFADIDLCACAETLRCDNYPDGLVELAEKLPPGPWMYTGGLENHPEVVEQIAAMRPLWGNAAEVLREVRDPVRLYEALRAGGLPALEVSLDPNELPRDGSWLAKPRAGSGGKLVHVFDANSAVGRERGSDPEQAGSRWYFQRRQQGLPAAAVFIGCEERGRFLLLTEQLLGQAWCGGGPFQYAGSIAPLPASELLLDASFTAELVRLGDTLAAEFGLVGLFGVDGVIHDRHFWPVEVNPRYTASCEVVERFTGLNLISLHAAACDERELIVPPMPHRPGGVGKAIVFAQTDGNFTQRAANWVETLNAEPGNYLAADIPRLGTSFAAGDPILTLIAHADLPADVRNRLGGLANELRRQLV